VDRTHLLRRTFNAAVRPVNLLAPGLGTAVAGSLLTAGLPPLALAVGALSALTWGAMVAWDVVSKSDPTAPVAALEPELAAPFGALLQAVEESAQAVMDRIDAHDGAVGTTLLEVRADCVALVEAARRLAQRGDTVHRWMITHDSDDVRAQIKELGEAQKRARDKAAAASFEAAVQARRNELKARDGIRDIGERIIAELVATDAGLDELHARVVALTLSDPADADARSDAVARDVRALRDQVSLLEKAAAATLLEV
jgi:hypothetical protein